MQDDEHRHRAQGVTWKSIAITLVLIPSRGDVARGRKQSCPPRCHNNQNP